MKPLKNLITTMQKLFYPKQSPLWFTQNPRTILYFLRELTGVIISIYCIYFAISWWNDEPMNFVRTSLFWWISMVTLGASILHSVTWLWVSTQLSPVTLSKAAQQITFIVLVGLAIVLSFGLYYLFYS